MRRPPRPGGVQGQESVTKNLGTHPNEGLENAQEQINDNMERKAAKTDKDKARHDKAMRAEKAERPEKADRPERPDRPERAGRS
jgi:hypothetical protein